MPKKYHIHTLGCQQNRSDSERVASVFQSIGYQATEDEKDADVVVVNSCAIRQTSMDRVYGKLRHWRPRQEKGELITILTGCVLKHDRERLGKEFDYIVDLEDIPKIPEVIGEGDALDLEDYFSVIPKHDSEFKAFVPIMTGCDKFCTYCAVPYTRGREISRPAQDILDECIGLVKKGYKEITLLGQNVNSYVGQLEVAQEKRGLLLMNRKAKAAGNAPMQTIDFSDLLQMVAGIPGDFWIRYVTSHPYDMSDKLIETMAKNEKIVNWINLPVQAGSDAIIKKMNRHYTVEHYKERVSKIRELLNPVALSTDIIVGFCGETEEEFQETLDLMQEMQYDMAYINKYSPRPGTVAERKYEDSVPWGEKKRRDHAVNEVLKLSAQKINDQLIGKVVRVLVDEAKSDESGMNTNTGKTDLWKTVQFDSVRDYTGKFVDVNITEARAFALKGDLV
jgi:tRNA-2-methylthio-N6-dimethylallyladenosine synthase